ncbi:MAG: OmpH family outer membrane protein [Planctomycetes bacterium]|nr:OmpH family outer membrane protein [Planctomycetota bacterium]
MVVKINVLAALLGVLGGGLVLVSPAPAPQEPAVKIGFVNIFKVRNASKQQEGLDQKLGAALEREQKAWQEREDKLGKQLREELPLYEKGSAEYNKLKLALQLDEHRLKLEQQQILADYERQGLAVLEEFMKRLERVVGDYAAAHGFTAILLSRPVPAVKSREELQALNNQWVIYHDRSLDVTDDIIKVFDQP